jgi:HK97 gp10 family phage protein
VSTLKWHDGALTDLFESPQGPTARDLERRAVNVETAAKRSVSSQGRGRTYQLSNPKRTHRASAPGAPPAVDLGRLRSSINHRLGTDSRGLFAVVGTKVAYARALELGTSRMAPRPFLRPALAATDLRRKVTGA